MPQQLTQISRSRNNIVIRIIVSPFIHCSNQYKHQHVEKSEFMLLESVFETRDLNKAFPASFQWVLMITRYSFIYFSIRGQGARKLGTKLIPTPPPLNFNMITFQFGPVLINQNLFLFFAKYRPYRDAGLQFRVSKAQHNLQRSSKTVRSI